MFSTGGKKEKYDSVHLRTTNSKGKTKWVCWDRGTYCWQDKRWDKIVIDKTRACLRILKKRCGFLMTYIKEPQALHQRPFTRVPFTMCERHAFENGGRIAGDFDWSKARGARAEYNVTKSPGCLEFFEAGRVICSSLKHVPISAVTEKTACSRHLLYEIGFRWIALQSNMQTLYHGLGESLIIIC